MSFFEFLDLFTLSAPIILLMGVIVGIYFYKNVDILRKILTFYLALMFLLDVSSRVIGDVYGTNIFLLPIYGFVELFMFSLFYYYLGIKDSIKLKTALIFILVLSLGYTVWEIDYIQNTPINELETFSKVVSTLITVLLSIGFFLEKILTKKEISSDLFMLNSGILLFYSLNLIIFIPLDFLINGSELKFYFWLVNLIFTLIFYIFLISSIWKNGKTRG